MKAGRLVSFAVAAGLAASVEGQVAKPTEPYAQPLGSGAVRFFESEEAFKAAQSSFALEATPRRALPLPKDFPFTPRFGTNGDQQLITVTKPPGVRLYGLGPIPGSMLRDGFKSESPIDFPWVMGIRPDGTAFGIMVDTGYITGVDLTKDIVFSTPAPNPGLIIWEAPEPHDLLVALNEQSGRMEMPPRWSLGFSVTTDRDPVSLARELRSRAIPTDSMSIPAGDARAEGSTGVEDKPAAELQVLRGLNIHAIQTLFAAAPVHPGVAAYDTADNGGFWVRRPDGSAAESRSPDRYRLPDFSRAPVRKWWADSVFAVVDRGIDGLQSGKFLDLPADALVEPEGPPAVAANPYRAVFFGMADHATREGFREQQRDRRPVVWSGSLTPGSQRWAATDLPIPSGCTPRDSLREALSLSLSGQPLSRGRIPLPGSAGISLSCFIGVDSALPLVCGFLSFDPDSPYMSAAESAAALGSALTRRSRLIPYYYTLCFNAFRDCEPILRPLFFADPKDLTLRDRDDAFFVGPELLVVPKLEKDKPKPPCPLKGGWRKIAWSPEEGGDQPDLPDLYLRPGAILPLGPVMQWTSEKPLDPLTLLINLDSFGSATGVLYEDDGDGYGFYRNQCRRITYKAETKDGSVFIRLAGLDGGLPMPRRKMEVRLLTDAGEVTAIGSERGTLKIDLPKPP